jgi:hypothetical protein
MAQGTQLKVVGEKSEKIVCFRLQQKPNASRRILIDANPVDALFINKALNGAKIVLTNQESAQFAALKFWTLHPTVKVPCDLFQR